MDTTHREKEPVVDCAKILELDKHYSAQNYLPLPVVLTRGEGVYLWDTRDNRYMDMMSAYSAVSLGHGHPRLLKALQQQAARLAVVSRAFHSDRLAPLLEKLCGISAMDMALPMNTGAEAVETAIKAARKWAYEAKGVAPGRAHVIACENNFHGRTLAVIAMSTEALYKNGFEPMPAGFSTVAYGDAQALEKAITADTAAFIVEPVQGEAGIVLPPPGYLRACSEICRRHNVMLICDEVQTGLGRTGAWFAHQHEGIRPDGLILGKALGGGLLPVSMFLARKDVMDVFTPGTHGSTFGGNPLACAVAHEVLDIMEEGKLVEKAHDLGLYFQSLLRQLSHPAIVDVRGLGMLNGVEFSPVLPARQVCEKLMEFGILSKETHDTVVRFAPPLTVSREQLQWAVERIQKALDAL